MCRWMTVRRAFPGVSDLESFNYHIKIGRLLKRTGKHRMYIIALLSIRQQVNFRSRACPKAPHVVLRVRIGPLPFGDIVRSEYRG